MNLSPPLALGSCAAVPTPHPGLSTDERLVTFVFQRMAETGGGLLLGTPGIFRSNRRRLRRLGRAKATTVPALKSIPNLRKWVSYPNGSNEVPLLN